MTNRHLRAVVFGCVLATTLPTAGRAAVQAQGGGLPAVAGQAADPVATLIRELKQKAFAAERAGRLQDAFKAYEEVLTQDPNDLLARSAYDTLKKALDEQTRLGADKEINLATDAAVTRDVNALLTKGRADLLDARTARSGEALDRAATAAADARALFEKRPGLVALRDPIAQFEQQVADERARQTARFWELWGGVAVIALLVLGGLVAYFWKRGGTLEMLEGPEPGRVFRIDKDLVALGLGGDADWPIVDPQRRVSRHHCDIVREKRRYFLVDRSTNGTLLNGRMVRPGEPVLLRRGDQIGLGGAVTLRFH